MRSAMNRLMADNRAFEVYEPDGNYMPTQVAITATELCCLLLGLAIGDPNSAISLKGVLIGALIAIIIYGLVAMRASASDAFRIVTDRKTYIFLATKQGPRFYRLDDIQQLERKWNHFAITTKEGVEQLPDDIELSTRVAKIVHESLVAKGIRGPASHWLDQ